MYRIKSLILLFVALCFSVAMEARPVIRTEISESVELLGTIARLAQFEEYNGFGDAEQDGGLYTRRIDEYFVKYKNHKAVKMLKMLREERGIGFVDIPSLAVNVEIVDGDVRLLKPDEVSLDERWLAVDVKKFVGLVNDFYHKSHYHDFFVQQLSILALSQQFYDDMLAQVLLPEWFEGFFGTTFDVEIRVLVGGVNGVNNYAWQHVSKSCDVTTIFAVINYLADSKGNPRRVNNVDYLSTLVNEICRYYVNRLSGDGKCREMLEPIGKVLYQKHQDVSQSTLYSSWEEMMNETFARAATIVCLHENNDVSPEFVDMLVVDLIEHRGLFLLPGVVEAFTISRQKGVGVKSFCDYYPIVIEVLRSFC